MIAVTPTVVTTHVIIGTIDVDTIVGTIVTGTADAIVVAAADFGHVILTDAVATTIEEAVMTTVDEITMTTIHVITIQDHVIMTEEIMIDDQMMKILRRKGIIIRVIPAKNDILRDFIFIILQDSTPVPPHYSEPICNCSANHSNIIFHKTLQNIHTLGVLNYYSKLF